MGKIRVMPKLNIFIFDVDGTLTEPRQKMDNNFSYFFKKFCERNTVALASGSDYNMVKEQVPLDIIYACMGSFCCMGNELRVNDEIIYTSKLKIPNEVINWLYYKIQSSKYPLDNFSTQNFCYRSGMLNFSIPGRDIPFEERERYYQWDLLSGERQKICEEFNKEFSMYNLEACVGGKISIDIQGIGKDKGQIYDYLSFYKTKIFFGDKCEKGGNDYSLYQKCEKSFKVKSWKDTFKILVNLNSLNSFVDTDFN